MGVIVGFFEWLYKKLKQALSMVVSFGGLVVSAVASVSAFVAGLFGRFTWLENASQYIDSAAGAISNLSANNLNPFVKILLRYFAFDQLGAVLVGVVGATFGVVILTFITITGLIMVLVPSILGIRAVLKAIKTASVGVLDP